MGSGMYIVKVATGQETFSMKLLKN
jgi:hypothetical protein